MLDIVKRHLAAFSSSNWTEYRATLAPDAVYEEVASLERVVGIEKFVASAQRWKTAFPDLKATIARGYTVGERVIVELEWEGTQSGPLEGTFGMLPPTRRRGRLNALILFTVKQGKIVESRNYFDMLTMLSQLGVSTAIGAQPGTSPSSVRV
ncbi:MAG TPA: ester cyclase [Kofleriaceae bacterium]